MVFNENDSSMIFKDLKFHISDKLNHPAKLEQLSRKIMNAGGKRNISPSPDCIFVLNQFFDDEYKKLNSHGVPIISVSYLEECLSKSHTIDVAAAKITPIHSDCMRDKVICLDRKSCNNCKDLAMKVGAMGGVYNVKLTPDSFALVTQNICSQKSKEARQRLNIPLVTPEWIEKCWQDGFSYDIASFSKPLLRGCVVCPTGYKDTERRLIEQLCVENGGVFAPALQKGESTHLIARELSGQKYDAARLWGVSIVPMTWLEDSVRHGLQSELLYSVESTNGTGTLGSYDYQSSSTSSPSLRHSVNSYIPTPLPQPIASLASDQPTPADMEMLQYNDIQPPSDIFRSKTFALLDFGEEEHKTINLVRQYTEIILREQVPSLLSTQLSIDYVLAPHGHKIDRSQLPANARAVSIDWFDACLRHNKILEPRECIYYTPMRSKNILEGAFLVANGFPTTNIESMRLTSKILGAKFGQRVGKQTTHLVLPNTNYQTNPEFKMAIKKNKNPNTQKIYILQQEWLFESARRGYRLDEYDYLFAEIKHEFTRKPPQPQHPQETASKSSIFKGFKVYISSKIEPEKQSQYQTMIKELGGETTVDFFTITHYLCERVNQSETQMFVQNHTINNVRPDWLLSCWESNQLFSELDFRSLDPIESDVDDCQPPIIQPISNQHSQLFNGISKSNDNMEIEIETENDQPAEQPKPATQETDSDESSEDVDDGKPSALDRLFRAINNLPEQKSSTSNLFTIPSIIPKRKASTRTTAIVPATKLTSLDLTTLDNDDEEKMDMSDGAFDDEDAESLSQRITYGEGMDSFKRLKLMKSNTKGKSKDNTTEQQYLLDILKRGQPIQNIVKPNATNYMVLSGFNDQDKTKLQSSLSKIEKFGFYQQQEPNITFGKTTHLILCAPKRSEKYLCGLAAGIWCLKSDFIHEVIASNQPVDETPFEWTTTTNENEKVNWAEAAPLCRKAVARLQRPLLSKAKFVMGLQAKKNTEAWTNIFRSGGAIILDEKDIAQATHRMTEENQTFPNDPSHIQKITSTKIIQNLLEGKHLVTD